MSIKFTKPYFPAESRRQIVTAIERMLESGQLMLGEYTEKLEMGFASHHGTQFAVSTNSCTSAMQACLMHYDVRDHDVLVPSAGFITDVSVVSWTGGNPILVDTDPATLSFDLDDLKRKLTPKAKGIIWVHLTGLISPAWEDIVAFAKEHGLFLLEDCAHAHGASVNARMAGTLGDVGVFSFYPTKLMTSGTGGILVTNDPALVKSAREIRLFGRENGTGGVVREGNDWFLDEIRACVAYHQLLDLESFVARRREIASQYTRLLAGVKGITLLEIPTGNLPSWYHFCAFVDETIDYNELARNLKEKHGVPTKPIYIPLHQEKIFTHLDDGSLRKTEKALNRSLCLPLFVDMTDDQVTFVADALKAELDVVLRKPGSGSTPTFPGNRELAPTSR
jgi:perosamine synthetase